MTGGAAVAVLLALAAPAVSSAGGNSELSVLTSAEWRILSTATGCASAFRPVYAEAFGVSRAQWAEDCAAGKTGYDVLLEYEVNPVMACIERFSFLADQGVPVDEVNGTCLDGRLGERRLAKRYGVEPPAVSSTTAPLPPERLGALDLPAVGPTEADLPPLDEPFALAARIIVRYADPRDAWLAVRALTRGQELVLFDEETSQSWSGRYLYENGEIIGIKPGYVLLGAATGYFPLDPAHYKTAAPPLAALQPSTGTPNYSYGLLEDRRYSDGSYRVEYSSYEIASILLHELAHLERRAAGGGSNRLTDERDARDAENRLLTRILQREIFTPRYALSERLHAWHTMHSMSEADRQTAYRAEGWMPRGDARIETQTVEARDAVTRARLKADARESALAADYQRHWRWLCERELEALWRRRVERIRAQFGVERSTSNAKLLQDYEGVFPKIMAQPWVYIIDSDRFDQP